MIFDHPRRTWSWANVRRTAPQFAVGKFMDTGAMAVPIAGVRFGHSTSRRRGRRRPPPHKDLAQTVTRRLAASTIAPPGSSALLNRG
jgi:hypothetical protein